MKTKVMVEREIDVLALGMRLKMLTEGRADDEEVVLSVETIEKIAAILQKADAVFSLLEDVPKCVGTDSRGYEKCGMCALSKICEKVYRKRRGEEYKDSVRLYHVCRRKGIEVPMRERVSYYTDVLYAKDARKEDKNEDRESWNE